MEISFMGLIILILLFYSIYINKLPSFIDVLLMFGFFATAGFFININNFLSISYIETAILINSIFIINDIFKIKINKNFLIKYISFFFVGVLSIYISKANNNFVLPLGITWDEFFRYNENYISINESFVYLKNIIYQFLMSFLLIATIIHTIKSNKFNFKNFLMLFHNISFYVALFSILSQILKKYIGEIYNDLFIFLFGSNNWLSLTGERMNIPTGNGLAREPSEYVVVMSYALVAFFILTYKYKFKGVKFQIKFITVLLSIIISGSFLGILIIILYFITILIYEKNIKTLIFIFFCISFSMLFIDFDYYLNRLNNLFLSEVNIYDGGSVRIFALKNSITKFLESPFIGFGLYSYGIYTLFFSLLLNVGIIGLIIYFSIIIKSLYNIRHEKTIFIGLIFLYIVIFLSFDITFVFSIYLLFPIIFGYYFREIKF